MKASVSPISAREAGEKRSQSLSIPLKFRSHIWRLPTFPALRREQERVVRGSLAIWDHGYWKPWCDRWETSLAGGDERVTCKGSAELELGNIVPGVFNPVLAKRRKQRLESTGFRKIQYVTRLRNGQQRRRTRRLLLAHQPTASVRALLAWRAEVQSCEGPRNAL